MSEEEGRLPNFVDLARDNVALLVPSIAAAFVTAAIFQTVVVLSKKRDSTAFRPAQIGVFFTTLIDTANIVSALTFDRTSAAGKLQIVGAFFHVIASFFWRWTMNGMSPVKHTDDTIFITSLFPSAFVIIGEILETVAVILTLIEQYFVPAVCLVSAVGALGSVWFCIELCAVKKDRIKESLKNARRPVVFVGEVLYGGIIAIATVQNWRNIFLLFPEVPFDLLEFCVISYRGSESDGEGDDVETARPH